ncbi:MAG: flagellin [Alphaproteobacteria bacterium]|nr:flagellin [Alphaproteobacteria bacterium]
MSFSVNTNSNALAALETLNLTAQSLTSTQRKVSTGLRVASAADDASTFAIAQGQRGDIAGFQSIANSLSLGTATLNVALQGAQTISNTLNEIKGKIVAAEDPTQDHNAIQNDISAFINQIDSVAAAAQFNGVNLIASNSTNENVLSSLNRSGSTVSAASITVNAQHLDSASLGIAGINVANQGAELQITGSQNFGDHDTFSLVAGSVLDTATNTLTGGVTTTFEFVNSGTETLTAATNIAVSIGSGLGGTIAALNQALLQHGFNASFDTAGNVDITSAAGNISSPTYTAIGAAASVTATTLGAGSTTVTALNTIETAINSVKTALSSLGTASNQIQTQSNFVKTLTDALTNGVGDLVDADLAAESAQLQALQTKQQLGIQSLSIANQGPGAVLTLFR